MSLTAYVFNDTDLSDNLFGLAPLIKNYLKKDDIFLFFLLLFWCFRGLWRGVGVGRYLVLVEFLRLLSRFGPGLGLSLGLGHGGNLAIRFVISLGFGPNSAICRWCVCIYISTTASQLFLSCSCHSFSCHFEDQMLQKTRSEMATVSEGRLWKAERDNTGTASREGELRPVVR